MFAFLLPLALASAGSAASARGEARAIFSHDDYPESAILLGQEGTVQARVTVGTDGRPTDCTVIRSSGHESLDAATCNAVMSRARFAPGRDDGGRPIVSHVTTPPVTWRIEGFELPVDPWSSRLMVALDKKDKPASCAVQFGGAMKRRQQYLVDCSNLAGAIDIPEEVAGRYSGRKPVLIFDRQFVPRAVNSINTPKDLARFPLLSRQVARLDIDSAGRVAACRQTGSEGEFKPAKDLCLQVQGQRYRPDRKQSRGAISATSTSAIYVYVK